MTTRTNPGTSSPVQPIAMINAFVAALGMVAALPLGAAPEMGLIVGAWIGFVLGLGVDELGVS